MPSGSWQRVLRMNRQAMRSSRHRAESAPPSLPRHDIGPQSEAFAARVIAVECGRVGATQGQQSW